MSPPPLSPDADDESFPEVARLSDMTSANTPPDPQRYFAYADGVGRAHGHVVEAQSYEAAAVGYTELYAPPVDSDGDVRIFVTGLVDGQEHCFVVDLGDGQAEPCD